MFCLAARDDAGAARGKSAAIPLAGVPARFAWKFEQRGIAPFERLRRSQKTGRIGMLRIIKHCGCWPYLNDLTGIHHGDPVAQIAGDRQIMRDE